MSAQRRLRNLGIGAAAVTCALAFDPHGQQAMCPFVDGQPQYPCARNPADNYDPNWDASTMPNCGYQTVEPEFPTVLDDGSVVWTDSVTTPTVIGEPPLDDSSEWPEAEEDLEGQEQTYVEPPHSDAPQGDAPQVQYLTPGITVNVSAPGSPVNITPEGAQTFTHQTKELHEPAQTPAQEAPKQDNTLMWVGLAIAVAALLK